MSTHIDITTTDTDTPIDSKQPIDIKPRIVEIYPLKLTDCVSSRTISDSNATILDLSKMTREQQEHIVSYGFKNQLYNQNNSNIVVCCEDGLSVSPAYAIAYLCFDNEFSDRYGGCVYTLDEIITKVRDKIFEAYGQYPRFSETQMEQIKQLYNNLMFPDIPSYSDSANLDTLVPESVLTPIQIEPPRNINEPYISKKLNYWSKIRLEHIPYNERATIFSTLCMESGPLAFMGGNIFTTSERLRSALPELRSWSDGARYGIPSWALDYIWLNEDCLDPISMPDGRVVYLGGEIGADMFCYTNCNVFRVDVTDDNSEFYMPDDINVYVPQIWREKRIFERMLAALDSGQKVLVNCQMGMSRSTSTLIGFMMWLEKHLGIQVNHPSRHIQTMIEARWAPGGSRQRVAPNLAFHRQLVEYYQELTN
jgi:predicted protein tyrosine phosphatase